MTFEAIRAWIDNAAVLALHAIVLIYVVGCIGGIVYKRVRHYWKEES